MAESTSLTLNYKPDTMAELMCGILASTAEMTQDAFNSTPELWELLPRSSVIERNPEDSIATIRKHEEKIAERKKEVLAIYDAAITDAEPLILFLKNGRKTFTKDSGDKAQELSEIRAQISFIRGQLSKLGDDPVDNKIRTELKFAMNKAFAQERNLAILTDREALMETYTEKYKKLLRDGSIELPSDVEGGKPKIVQLPENSSVKKYLLEIYRSVVGDGQGNPVAIEKQWWELVQDREVALHGADRLMKIMSEYSKLTDQHIREKQRRVDVSSQGASSINLKDDEEKLKDSLPKIRNIREKKWNEVYKSLLEGKRPAREYHAWMLVGEPGVGKTAMMKDLADMLETNLLNFSMPQFRSSSFGFLMYDTVTGAPRTELPDDTKSLVTNNGVAVLDEFTRTRDNPGVQNGLIKLLLEHTVAGYRMHPMTPVVAATNPIREYDSDIQELGVAGVQRLWYVDLISESVLENIVKPGWLEWANSKYRSAYSSPGRSVVRDILAFLQDKSAIGGYKDFLIAIPEAELKGHEAFPTPRSWTSIIETFSKYEDEGVKFSEREIETRVQREVGEKATAALLTFMRRQNSLPTLAELKERIKSIATHEALCLLDSDFMMKDNGEIDINDCHAVLYRLNGSLNGLTAAEKKLIADKGIAEKKIMEIDENPNLTGAEKHEKKQAVRNKNPFAGRETYKEFIDQKYKKEGKTLSDVRPEIATLTETKFKSDMKQKLAKLWSFDNLDSSYKPNDAGIAYSLRSILSNALVMEFKTSFSLGKPVNIDEVEKLLKLTACFPHTSMRSAILRDFFSNIILTPSKELLEGFYKYGFARTNLKGVIQTRTLDEKTENEPSDRVRNIIPFLAFGRMISDSLLGLFFDRDSDMSVDLGIAEH